MEDEPVAWHVKMGHRFTPTAFRDVFHGFRPKYSPTTSSVTPKIKKGPQILIAGWNDRCASIFIMNALKQK